MKLVRAEWLDAPDPSRLDPGHPDFDAIMAAHAAAVRCGLSTYRDPRTGYTVMTARYLDERGYCCSSGCRHCPYLETRRSGE